MDEEFARYACEHNMKWNDSNLFVDSSVTSLSNCPVDKDTKILYYNNKTRKYFCSSIKELYNRLNENISVISNGSLVPCKVNRFNEPADYRIELANGATITTTGGHFNLAYNKGYIKTNELTKDDYLPFSLTPFEQTKNMSYEDGRIVGMFLGDGSYADDNSVIFSLNRGSKLQSVEFVENYCVEKFNANVSEYDSISELSGKPSCVNVRVMSSYLRGLISQFVNGDNVLNKGISYQALGCSLEFRRGILDGLYETDGGNSQRIYTSSENLKDTLVTMLCSMGMCSTISVDTRDGRLGTNPCYTIRWYKPEGRTTRKDAYIIDDNYMWFKIKSIERIETKSQYSYCLEVLDDSEPVFMLGNGIYTHNCRLKSNIEDLGYFNSIGGTALKVGSVKVSTINLARLALENNTEEKYLAALKDMCVLDMQVLDCVRNIITRNVDKGLLKNFSCGIVDFNSLYSTIGFIGIYETMKTFGYIRKDELGNTFYTKEAENFGKKIFDVIHSTKAEFMKHVDYHINCEQIPGETAATKLMKKDAFFFPDKVVKDLPLYGNQFIPLGIKTTLQERIRIASLFDSYCNGG